MINFRRPETGESPATDEKAISLISKGWREVKDSTEADIQLMKHRANSFTAIVLNNRPNLRINVSEHDFDDRQRYVFGYWETIRAFKLRLQKLDKQRSVFDGMKNNKFVVKVKSTLVSISFVFFDSPNLEFLFV